MKVEVVGLTKFNFKDKNENDVSGTRIFALMNPINGSTVGHEVLLRPMKDQNVFKIPFVPSSVCPNVELGVYDVEFDIKGGISSFRKEK